MASCERLGDSRQGIQKLDLLSVGASTRHGAPYVYPGKQASRCLLSVERPTFAPGGPSIQGWCTSSSGFLRALTAARDTAPGEREHGLETTLCLRSQREMWVEPVQYLLRSHACTFSDIPAIQSLLAGSAMTVPFGGNTRSVVCRADAPALWRRRGWVGLGGGWARRVIWVHNTRLPAGPRPVA